MKLSAKIMSTRPICKEDGRYIGWPTICRRRNGELLVVFSGDRDEHVCPWGKTQMVRSSDNGATWSSPVTINNTPLDDRDAGIIETADGTLIVSWFTSLAFASEEILSMVHIPLSMRESWRRHLDKLTPEIRESWLGSYIRRSHDGGVTWEDPVRVSVSAPHGPVELADGRLIYVGIRVDDRGRFVNSTEGDRSAYVNISTDGGCTWEAAGEINLPPGEEAKWYQEPHVAETADGKLVALFRYLPGTGENYMRQSESMDGGRTWSMPHSTPIYGFPPHLTRLGNGWLLASYGLRRPPYGERACISRDGGATWDYDSEIDLCHGINHDLGYPASAELPDGSIYTIYYQIDKPEEKTCLMATHWRLEIEE